ncbi:MAG: hypothetical protein NDJ89_05690 [Oligoflexia bacterium]|nr:hypothetical protein [Oligoflexia bacterium]
MLPKLLGPEIRAVLRAKVFRESGCELLYLQDLLVRSGGRASCGSRAGVFGSPEVRRKEES